MHDRQRNIGSMFMAGIVSVVLLLSITGFKGCKTPPEQIARNSIAAATGAIAQAQAEYKDQCVMTPGDNDCILINQAVYGQNAAITSLEIYCGWPANVPLPTADTVCHPVTTAGAALNSSVTHLNDLIGQIRAITVAKAPVPAKKTELKLPPLRDPAPVPWPAQTIPPQVISIAILGVKALLDSLLAKKGGGESAAQEIADETIGAVKGAYDTLMQHQGKDVTLGELEALRLHTLWPDAGHPAGSTGAEPVGGALGAPGPGPTST